jgi:hypothetical protein
VLRAWLTLANLKNNGLLRVGVVAAQIGYDCVLGYKMNSERLSLNAFILSHSRKKCLK